MWDDFDGCVKFSMKELRKSVGGLRWFITDEDWMKKCMEF